MLQIEKLCVIVASLWLTCTVPPGFSPFRVASPPLTWLVPRPRGEVVGRLEEEEGVVYSNIDLDFLESIRRQIPISEQRRHDVYSSEKLKYKMVIAE